MASFTSFVSMDKAMLVVLSAQKDLVSLHPLKLSYQREAFFYLFDLLPVNTGLGLQLSVLESFLVANH